MKSTCHHYDKQLGFMTTWAGKSLTVIKKNQRTYGKTKRTTQAGK
jgi:hypothetical protein